MDPYRRGPNNLPPKYARRHDTRGGSVIPPTSGSLPPPGMHLTPSPQLQPGGPVSPPMIHPPPSFQTPPPSAPQSANLLAGNPYSHLAGQGPPSYQYYPSPAPVAYAANFGSTSQQPGPSSFTAGPSNAGASSAQYYPPSAPVSALSAAPVAHAQQAGTLWGCPLCGAEFDTLTQVADHASRQHR